MKKPIRNYPVTPENLVAYQTASLANADALIKEATLLLASAHFARCYFLSEAAIEETGKAALAHFATGRNLSSPSVTSRLRIEFEDHSAKIRAAFFAWAIKLQAQQVKTELEAMVRHVSALKRGRESAMYADFRRDGTPYEPSGVVKQEVEVDCLLLARRCHAETSEMLRSGTALAYSAADDKLYSLGPKAMKVWEEEDFGEYLIDHIEKKGLFKLSEAITTYHDAFLSKGRRFREKPTVED